VVDPAKGEKLTPGPYKVGHVVRDEFPGGVGEVKEWLSRVKGTLVEMPLLFLKDEDMAKEGVGFNAFTEELYT
jgi:phospholipase D1/2